MQTLTVPQGEFHLARYPNRKKELLRAWDAADEYLLNYVAEISEHNNDLKLLIINDSFGALAVSLSGNHITTWSDSWLSHEGVKQNLSLNNISVDKVKLVKSIETPEAGYDLILIKIPRSLSLLEDQLIRLQPLISPETNIIAAGMVKSIHTSTLKLFEKYIGPTKTSLAKKKARLIFCSADENVKRVTTPYPKKYILEGSNYLISNHANVFSRESLDIGTRFFLQHLPQAEKYKKIIDLGCGNGVVGLLAAEQNPQAELLFIDESFMAVESARENFAAAFKDERNAEFKTNDGLTGLEKNSVDLILNNPPFHQDNAVGDEVAWQMFKQSYDVLKQEGELWVIGNRHLGYHIKLKKLFGNCEVIASNKKFVILKSIK